MGFFSLKAVCEICGKKLGLGRWTFSDKTFCCPECAVQLESLNLVPPAITSAAAKQALSGNNIVPFTVTQSVGNYLKIDDNNKQWQISDGAFGSAGSIRSYDSIIDYELIEDGSTLTKGGVSIGRAVVGGALFGETGAVLGGISGKTKTIPLCTNLKIKITLNDMSAPVTYITFINTQTKKDSLMYKLAADSAQQCLSMLNIICLGNETAQSQPQSGTSFSAADEIAKFKKLMDDGIITPEEFEKKKSELLGL